ncbi:MAG: box helicase [Gammaproteobacteria bacterium]|nr:box helicase [Gammaproteobacteria bacterium]
MRGDNYAAAFFPARAVHQMSGSFVEFAAHGFPPEIVEQWATDFPQGLNPLQLKAVNEFGVLTGQSLLVVARGIAVLNAGIGGNRLLQSVPIAGVSALARLERDVFSVPGLSYMILPEGAIAQGRALSKVPRTSLR